VAIVEGFVAPFETVDLLGVLLEELNVPPLCQGHLVPAQPDTAIANRITPALRDKELRIIRESFAKGQMRSPLVRRPPCHCPERPNSSMNPVLHRFRELLKRLAQPNFSIAMRNPQIGTVNLNRTFPSE
jgi:hypothetical protein